MIAAALGEVLLRQAPEALRAGLASGELKIFGSVVREASSGRIVGFLQEAAPFADVLQGLAGSALPGIGAAGDLGGLVQGHAVLQGIGRIEEGLSALTNLVAAGLVLDVVGIGVTITTAVVLAHKIDHLGRQIDAMSRQLDDLGVRVDQIRQDLVDIDLVEVTALARSFDEAWMLSPEPARRRWNEVAAAALSYQSRFEMRAARILAHGPGQVLLADPLLDAVSLTSALRVASLAACDEVAAAQAAAADGARSIERMTGGIGLSDLAREWRSGRTAVAGSAGVALDQARAGRALEARARKLRQRELAAHTRAAPLPHLASHGLTARAWLERARTETGSALLFLPAI